MPPISNTSMKFKDHIGHIITNTQGSMHIIQKRITMINNYDTSNRFYLLKQDKLLHKTM